MPIRVKMPHCWKAHVAAHILKTEEMTGDSWSAVSRIRRENVVVTKEIKLIKIEKWYCKRRKFNKNRNNSIFNSYNKKMSRNGFELTTQTSKYKCAIFICSTHWATQATDSLSSIIAVKISIVLKSTTCISVLVIRWTPKIYLEAQSAVKLC